MSFATVVQTAIYDKLANDTAVTNTVTGIYDKVPQPTDSGASSDFPYITIGEDILNNADTDTELMMQVSITIHVWSRYGGRSETKQIQGLIYDSLHRANLAQSGYKFVTITQGDSQSFLDADGETYHGVQTFNLLIEEL